MRLLRLLAIVILAALLLPSSPAIATATAPDIVALVPVAILAAPASSQREPARHVPTSLAPPTAVPLPSPETPLRPFAAALLRAQPLLGPRERPAPARAPPSARS